MLALRLPLASGWGASVSLVMFWALWSMIDAPVEIGKRIVAPTIEFTRKIVESEVAIIEPPSERPVRDIPATPPRPGPVRVPGEKAGPTVRHEGPVVFHPGIPVEIDAPHGGGGIDHDAEPVVRTKPAYPPSAAARGIEGWVQVQFSVTASGEVFDVSVVGASPEGVFEKATVAAVQRWRYDPKIVEGVAVERTGLQTVLRFSLD
jgi:periplasmic protein TonB